MEARLKRSSAIAAAAVSALAICFGMAPRAAAAAERTTAELLTQNFQAQHEIGHRFHIDPADLPEPKVGPIARLSLYSKFQIGHTIPRSQGSAPREQVHLQTVPD